MTSLIAPQQPQAGHSTIFSDSSICTGKKMIAVAGILLGSGLAIFAYTKLGPASLAGRVCLGMGVCVGISSSVALVVASRRDIAQVRGQIAPPEAPVIPEAAAAPPVPVTPPPPTPPAPEPASTLRQLLAALREDKNTAIHSVTSEGPFVTMSSTQRREALQMLAAPGIDVAKIGAIAAAGKGVDLICMNGAQKLAWLREQVLC